MSNDALTARIHPASFPRRILVAVTGLSPQVVTETLYALALTQTPAFVPTEIHLITTLEGAKRARLALLSEAPGAFHTLCRDYALPKSACVMGFPKTCSGVLPGIAKLSQQRVRRTVRRNFCSGPESAALSPPGASCGFRPTGWHC